MKSAETDLIQGYLADTLAPEQAAQVLSRLQTDPEFRAAWFERIENESVLWEFGREQGFSRLEQERATPAAQPAGEAGVPPAVRFPAGRSWRVTAVAAALLVGLGVFIARLSFKPLTPAGASPRVSYRVGDVRRSDGQPLARGEPAAVPVLQRGLRTGEGSALVLEYADATRLEVGANTEFKLLPFSAVDGKRLFVAAGEVGVAAAHGQPLRVITPHSRITVVGTRFVVGVSSASTRVALEAGRLSVACVKSGESVVLEPEHVALVADTIHVLPQEDPSLPADGLVGHWRFDEIAGKQAFDHSPAGNHGRIYRAERVKGPLGGALAFNGIDAYVDIGNPPELRLTGPMTASAWVTVNSLRNARIVAKQGNRNQRCWCLNIEQTGEYAFHIAAAPEDVRAVNAPIRELRRWVHLVGVYEPGRALRLYLDGELAGEVTANVPATQHDSAQPVNIGRRPDALPDVYWDGKIDDVRIYNRALSDTEVRALYHAGAETARRLGAAPQRMHDW
ncbi:MAG: FecR domain-containing protein [Kiritimatiellae bacterium]|nr:FecR domain-containing protein [Kiritimatiellia bacterium]